MNAPRIALAAITVTLAALTFPRATTADTLYWNATDPALQAVGDLANYSTDPDGLTPATGFPGDTDIVVFASTATDAQVWVDTAWGLGALQVASQPKYPWFNGPANHFNLTLHGTTVDGVAGCVLHTNRGGAINEGTISLAGGGDKVFFYATGGNTGEFRIGNDDLDGITDNGTPANLVFAGDANGRWRINGTVDIAGDITVNAGTVRIAGTALERSALAVNNPGRLNIQDRTKVYQVKALTVDGTVFGPGIYGVDDLGFSRFETNGGTNADNALIQVVASDTAPQFISELTDQTVFQGADATFTAIVAGTPPLTYSWTRDGSPAPVQPDGPSLTVADAQPEDAGTYQVTVTNALGTASASAQLTVTAVAGGGTTYYWNGTDNSNQSTTNDLNYSTDVDGFDLPPLDEAYPGPEDTLALYSDFATAQLWVDAPLAIGAFRVRDNSPYPWINGPEDHSNITLHGTTVAGIPGAVFYVEFGGTVAQGNLTLAGGGTKTFYSTTNNEFKIEDGLAEDTAGTSLRFTGTAGRWRINGPVTVTGNIAIDAGTVRFEETDFSRSVLTLRSPGRLNVQERGTDIRVAGLVIDDVAYTPGTYGPDQLGFTHLETNGGTNADNATVTVLGGGGDPDPPALRITLLRDHGDQFTIGGLGGPPDAAFDILTSADLATPLASWQVQARDTFDGEGEFFSRFTKPAGADRYFVISTGSRD